MIYHNVSYMEPALEFLLRFRKNVGLGFGN